MMTCTIFSLVQKISFAHCKIVRYVCWSSVDYRAGSVFENHYLFVQASSDTGLALSGEGSLVVGQLFCSPFITGTPFNGHSYSHHQCLKHTYSLHLSESTMDGILNWI